jgi:hypothetical protein
MYSKDIYQTLEDRDNPDGIEINGPFKCDRKDAWLGDGYYFWDTFIELAHWWGHKGYNGNYIICKSNFKYENDDIFDLVGNTEHIMDFRKIGDYLRKNVYKPEISVRYIVDYMKTHVRDFRKYKAIRVNGIDSINGDERMLENRYYFNKNNNAYLDCMPCIQLCVFSKKNIGGDNFKIVYPEMYCEDYTYSFI